MNKIKTSLLLLCTLFITQGVGAKVAKKATQKEELKSAPVEAVPHFNDEPKDFPCGKCHEKGDHPKHHLLGKPFTKSEVSYGSVKDHEFYEVQLEDGKFATYQKGEVDKEGIDDDAIVTIRTFEEEAN